MIIPLDTIDSLTAPGNGTVVNVQNYESVTVAYTITTINTNVVVRLEGSIDGTNWYALTSDTTQTTNNTFALQLPEGTFAGTMFIRFVFVSEAGGTAATITVKYAGQVD